MVPRIAHLPHPDRHLLHMRVHTVEDQSPRTRRLPSSLPCRPQYQRAEHRNHCNHRPHRPCPNARCDPGNHQHSKHENLQTIAPRLCTPERIHTSRETRRDLCVRVSCTRRSRPVWKLFIARSCCVIARSTCTMRWPAAIIRRHSSGSSPATRDSSKPPTSTRALLRNNASPPQKAAGPGA